MHPVEGGQSWVPFPKNGKGDGQREMPEAEVEEQTRTSRRAQCGPEGIARRSAVSKKAQ